MPRPFRAVITAGGTREPVDDVRVLANRSTGRFGQALARALATLGAEVVLVGSTSMVRPARPLPPSVTPVPYTTTDDLSAALREALSSPTDLVLMAAAVSDYRPVPADGKIPSDATSRTLTLHRTPKLLDHLRDWAGDEATLVGFKLLSGVTGDRLLSVARAQIARARLDHCVANDLSELGGADHPAYLVDAEGATRHEGPRDAVAAALARALVPDAGALPADLPPVDDLPRPGRPVVWCQAPRAPRAPALALPADADADALLAAWAASPPPEQGVIDLQRGDHRLLGLPPLRIPDLHPPQRPPGTAPLVDRGRLVAAAQTTPSGALRLHGAAPGPSDPWPARQLGAPGVPAILVPEDHAVAWAVHGYRPEDPARDGLVRLVAPTRHGHTADAASVCLWHAPTRQVLLGRRPAPPAAHQLAFPGGRREPAEPLADTARRELSEETGIAVPGPWLGSDTPVVVIHAGTDPTWAVHCHVVAVPWCPEPRPSEALDARWMTLDDARSAPDTTHGTRLVLDTLHDGTWSR